MNDDEVVLRAPVFQVAVGREAPVAFGSLDEAMSKAAESLSRSGAHEVTVTRTPCSATYEQALLVATLDEVPDALGVPCVIASWDRDGASGRTFAMRFADVEAAVERDGGGTVGSGSCIRVESGSAWLRFSDLLTLSGQELTGGAASQDSSSAGPAAGDSHVFSAYDDGEVE